MRNAEKSTLKRWPMQAYVAVAAFVDRCVQAVVIQADRAFRLAATALVPASGRLVGFT